MHIFICDPFPIWVFFMWYKITFVHCMVKLFFKNTHSIYQCECTGQSTFCKCHLFANIKICYMFHIFWSTFHHIQCPNNLAFQVSSMFFKTIIRNYRKITRKNILQKKKKNTCEAMIIRNVRTFTFPNNSSLEGTFSGEMHLSGTMTLLQLLELSNTHFHFLFELLYFMNPSVLYQ